MTEWNKIILISIKLIIQIKYSTVHGDRFEGNSFSQGVWAAISVAIV